MNKRHELRASLTINKERMEMDLWRDGEYYVAAIDGEGAELVVVAASTRRILKFLENSAEFFRKAQE
jgi:hypothetical protein